MYLNINNYKNVQFVSLNEYNFVEPIHIPYFYKFIQTTLMFFNGAISSGHFVSGVDLTPNYAGRFYSGIEILLFHLLGSASRRM